MSDAWKGPDMKHRLTPKEICQKHITRTSANSPSKKTDLQNYTAQILFFFEEVQRTNVNGSTKIHTFKQSGQDVLML